MFPGFVDLQVNGLRGVDFCSPRLTLEQIEQVSVALHTRGVVAYCPTVITSPMEVYERNLPILARACDCTTGAQVLGIHLEGPFLSPEDGARGVHPRQHIVEPSQAFFDRLRNLAEDRIAILTLAPERPGALPLIEHVLSNTRITPAIGHHLADVETIHRCADLGVRACVHVGNGLPELIHRHFNPLWPMLAEDRLTGLFISDGFHLPKDMLRVCLRAKGPERFAVTSDLSPLAGQPPGEYSFHGVDVVLEEDRHLHCRGVHQLAGSASEMIDCMNVMASLGELDESALRQIGFDTPLGLLRIPCDLDRLPRSPGVHFDGTHFSVAAGV